MNEREWRAAQERLAENRYLKAAAAELRHIASTDGYAGMRGRDVADRFAAALEAEALGMPTRGSLLRAAAGLIDGPDGANDPRSAQGKPIRP